VPRNLVLVALLAGIVALLIWMIRSAWRNRRVNFIHRVDAVGSEASSDALDRIVPVLVQAGYRMVASAGRTSAFERRSSLVAPIVISVLLFPFGLIALLLGSRETVTFVSSASAFEVYGRCSKPVADYLIAITDEAVVDQHFSDTEV
jgi:hypothetical protein